MFGSDGGHIVWDLPVRKMRKLTISSGCAGTDSYGDIPSDNPDYAVSRFDVSSALPPARVLLVSGEHSLQMGIS